MGAIDLGGALSFTTTPRKVNNWQTQREHSLYANVVVSLSVDGALKVKMGCSPIKTSPLTICFT